MLEHGSSPTGEGTFVHTKQGAMDEAAMDNLPLFDDAVFDERAHTLDLEEVGLGLARRARRADARAHR